MRSRLILELHLHTLLILGSTKRLVRRSDRVQGLLQTGQVTVTCGEDEVVTIKPQILKGIEP
jgi:hypothetical protein